MVLPEADFVGEDAAAFSQPPEREDDRVDLMRVRIDAAPALRGRVALAVVRPPDADEVLGEAVLRLNWCSAIERV